MNVVVSTEQRFRVTPDGAVWSPTAVFGPTFWARYLEVFSSVTVVARSRAVESRPLDWTRVDGPSVRLSSVPDYVGPLQLLGRLPSVLLSLRDASTLRSACVLRVPSTLGSFLATSLVRQRRPFALEVVGDPWDVFAPGATTRSPLRPVFRSWFSRGLRTQCAQAAATAYVTSRALQRRYPPGSGSSSFAVSTVDLPGPAYAQPRSHLADPSVCRLISVGSMDRLYKGFDVLLRALALLRGQSPRFELTIVGAGRHLAQLQALSAALDLAGAVRFAGQLPDPASVRAALDEADVFVLASRTEGLPRAMLEAMARGLPCVGTSVGGIPELLPADRCAPPDAPGALRAVIEALARDPARFGAAARRDFDTSLAYSAERLQRVRRRFYEEVRRATQEHLDRVADASRRP